ncbi:MAG: hypothetical protein ACK5LC_17815 [Coprobacillaceae bacterium]
MNIDSTVKYNIKILKSGKYTEVYIYHDKIFTRSKKKEKDKLAEKIDRLVDELIIDDAKLKTMDEPPLTEKQLKAIEKIRKKNTKRTELSINKSKQKLRRLINSNLGKYKQLDKFLTLTYGYKMKDRNKAHNHLKVFIRNIRRKYGDQIEYIAVLEIQDGSRRKDKDKKKATNNLHWHILLFDMPFVQYEILQKSWKHGHLDIRKIQEFGDVAGYLTNYLGDDDILSLGHKKSYTSSKGLFRLEEELTTDKVKVANIMNEEGSKILYNGTFQNGQVGKFTYMKIENTNYNKKE